MESIILWILALFGILDLILRIIESLYIENGNGETDVVIKVKNQEKTIEALVRDLSKISLIGKIKVIDMNSNDATVEILKKIQKRNKIVEIIEE